MYFTDNAVQESLTDGKYGEILQCYDDGMDITCKLSGSCVSYCHPLALSIVVNIFQMLILFSDTTVPIAFKLGTVVY